MNTNTTHPTYWSNDNGYTVCNEHAGNYLASAIKKKPNAIKHKTPLGTWELLDEETAFWMFEEFGKCCELCEED
jgi:hypothetical protein